MMKNFNDGFIYVIDNFLPKYTFQRIQELVLSTDFFGIGQKTITTKQTPL